jgi:hypothetical protein
MRPAAVACLLGLLVGCDDGELNVRSSGTTDGGPGGGGTGGRVGDAGRDGVVGGIFDPLGGGPGVVPTGGTASGGNAGGGGDRPDGGGGWAAGGEADLGVRPPPVDARSVTLVEFGCAEDQVRFGVPGWDTLLRSEHMTWVGGGDPTRCGLTDREGTPPQRAFAGVAGRMPIDFPDGRQIVATVFHRSGHDGQRLRMRVSFRDADAPEGATNDAPWYTMYVEQAEGSPRVGTTGRIVFNLTTEETAACQTAPPTVGAHSLVNVSFDHPDSVPGQWVLTRLELTNHVDRSPPTRPKNLVARRVSLSPEAGQTGIELTWERPTDPPGSTGGEGGISRYWIYRDGVPYDLVSRDWTQHHGASVRFVDIGVVPGRTYRYGVTAVDTAVTGLYPGFDDIESHRMGNESAPAEIEVVAPDWTGCGLIGPGELEYRGAFAAPQRDDWAYSGMALTYFPGGNPAPGPEELPGSLYVTAHDREMLVGELSIRSPIPGRPVEALHEARILRDAVNIWPRVYDGRWQPRGEVETRVGLAWHPGVEGVGSGLHYSIFMSYAGDQNAAVHGMLETDLSAARGPWHLGGQPGAAGHVPFLFTGKFVTRLPQAFADAAVGGRSLMVGLGWPISGHGFPSAGPALGAIAPWESGRLPDPFGVVSHRPLLRYGGTGEVARWQNGWTPSHYYLDAEFLEAGDSQALIFAALRPRGDEWYGGENGYDNFYCDADVPPHIGEANLRGPVDSDNVPMLLFYNPADLARVASGAVEAHVPQPFAQLELDDVLLGGEGRYPKLRALAFDAERRRLFAWENGATRFGHAVVHVWHVGEGRPCE